MKPGETHFTGSLEELEAAGVAQARRNQLAVACLEFTQAVRDNLSVPPAKRVFSARNLAEGYLWNLTVGDGPGAYFNGGGGVDKLANNVSREPSVVVSRPYDFFTEESTGTNFVCAAVSCKAYNGMINSIIVALPRSPGVPEDAELTLPELSASVPLALVQFSDGQAPVCYGAESTSNGGTNFTTLTPARTEDFVYHELPRVVRALQ